MQLAGIVFQACSIDHSDISPFRINDLRAVRDQIAQNLSSRTFNLTPALMKILASHIPNAELLVVPNAGHSVYWEEPELFNGTVLNFIRKH